MSECAIAPLPESVDLEVPWLSQLDNVNSPLGTCNLTSASMIVLYFGIRGDGNGQLEDQVFRRCEAFGYDRHTPDAIAEIIRSYGFKDEFRTDATWGGREAAFSPKTL